MRALSLSWALAVALVAGQMDPPPRAISDEQVRNAIEMGRRGDVPIVQVGTILGVSRGDFNVFIEGPIARIAGAALSAFRQYKPFDSTHVTPKMKEAVYRVIFKQDYDSASYRSRPVGSVKHVVLQPRRAKGMDGVIQPLRENVENGQAFFDRFPEGEFDVVIVTENEVQKFNVSPKQRERVK